MKVRLAHLLGANVCESAGLRCAERVLELDHLHGDLDREPVVAAQVESRELANAPEPLPQRVGMDVQRLRGGADRAVTAKKLLERRQELRATLRVVLGELPNRVDGRVADSTVDGYAEEVLVRTEIVVREHGGLPAQDRSSDEGLLGLGEAVRE